MTGKLYAMGEMLIDFTPAGEGCRAAMRAARPLKPWLSLRGRAGNAATL